MKLSVTFRHMDPSEALKEHMEDKLSRFQKYAPDPVRAEVVFSTERHLNQADVTVVLADGTPIKGKVESDDMYTAVDLVMDKIDRQIRRYKDKQTSRQRTSA